MKLTKESAEAVKKYGLMPTKTPGVSHAMTGKPGEIKQWLQVAQAPGVLLSGPMALSALSTMMQQRAMQQQMDEIVEYLQEINEKVDDILRSQKNAVLADMIGAELIIEEGQISAKSPRRPRTPHRRSENGSQSSHVASNLRMGYQCSNSTECSTPRRKNSTGTASG